MFRKSSTKNDLLQNYVNAEFNKSYSLILDVKTRWNSLLSMLERFNKMQTCVQKALIDLSSDISFSATEMGLLQEIISLLTPVKIAVEALCRSDANLLTADATLNFLLSTIKTVNSAFSTELREALEEKIFERRSNAAAVLQFLHNAYQTQDERPTHVFKKLTKTAICNFIFGVLNRVKNKEPEMESNVDENSSDEDCIEVPTENLNDMLQRAIDKEISTSLKPQTDFKNLRKQIMKDLNNLEHGGVRSKLLDELYNKLLSILHQAI